MDLATRLSTVDSIWIAGKGRLIMGKVAKYDGDSEMLEEYDFSKGERGRYAKRYAEGSNVVVLEPDVAEFFPDSDSVNEALRALIKIAQRKKKISA